jgi:glyoxylase-like metal-dependent hydrolase (beta-lactamase superfamily II)
MTLHSIDTGLFKLDGGAMFGVVPRVMWEKLVPPDSRNLCTWAMRCLLIEDAGRLTLVDTGIGTKQDPKFFAHYDLHGDATLQSSLEQLGVGLADITDVLLTHMHFDHVGGAVSRVGEDLRPTFPNATYWSNRRHWQWATVPNAREKASFLKENILPLEESGQLKFVEDGGVPASIHEIITVDGHTDQMMLPLVHYKGHKLVFCADLLPSHAHLPIPYVMGYDTRPLLTLDEKAAFLDRAAAENWILVFEHDAQQEACFVQRTDRGVRPADFLRIADL